MKKTFNTEIGSVAVEKRDPKTSEPLKGESGEEIKFKPLEFKYELDREAISVIREKFRH
ncbi:MULTISPECIES: hypothetical protein [unclassified Pseudomonas]|uniref:hypothetical protein n=1 Tax=unclassified Pseudomonas TaxID=196821 RepID=UPI0030D7077E